MYPREKNHLHHKFDHIDNSKCHFIEEACTRRISGKQKRCRISRHKSGHERKHPAHPRLHNTPDQCKGLQKQKHDPDIHHKESHIRHISLLRDQKLPKQSKKKRHHYNLKKNRFHFRQLIKEQIKHIIADHPPIHTVCSVLGKRFDQIREP